jgi:hypothetical protein
MRVWLCPALCCDRRSDVSTTSPNKYRGNREIASTNRSGMFAEVERRLIVPDGKEGPRPGFAPKQVVTSGQDALKAVGTLDEMDCHANFISGTVASRMSSAQSPEA